MLIINRYDLLKYFSNADPPLTDRWNQYISRHALMYLQHVYDEVSFQASCTSCASNKCYAWWWGCARFDAISAQQIIEFYATGSWLLTTWRLDFKSTVPVVRVSSCMFAVKGVTCTITNNTAEQLSPNTFVFITCIRRCWE